MNEEVISIGEPQVMSTPAGFYIGANCTVKYTWEDGSTWEGQEPWARYTDYMSEAEAKARLKDWH